MGNKYKLFNSKISGQIFTVKCLEYYTFFIIIIHVEILVVYTNDATNESESATIRVQNRLIAMYVRHFTRIQSVYTFFDALSVLSADLYMHPIRAYHILLTDLSFGV